MPSKAAPSALSHPFRRSLPRRVLLRLPEPEPEVRAAQQRMLAAQQQSVPPPDAATKGWLAGRITVQDVKEFLMAYCACFLAVSSFIN